MGQSPQGPTEFLAALTTSPAGSIFLAALVLVELSLFAVALIDWVRRPADQIKGNRILWLVLIAFVNMIGPIVYLLFARKAPLADDAAGGAATAESASKAVDVLYGPGDKIEPQ
jgi:hypothetical protein